MTRKRYKPEEIVVKLPQVDVLVSQGQNRVDGNGLTMGLRAFIGLPPVFAF